MSRFRVKKYDNVFIKDFNLKAMAKIGDRKIKDLVLNEFIGILATKTNVVKLINATSFKTCSCCRYSKKDLNLKDRVFDCSHCKAK